MREAPSYRVRWRVALPFAALHAGAVAAFFHIELRAILIAALLWFLTGLLGVTVGYHRLLAHRSFETYGWIKAFHLFWASLAFQQGPLSWVRLHRAHHTHSDTESDPHPQAYGFIYGHIGWAILDHRTRGKSRMALVAPTELRHDPVVRFFEAHHGKLSLGSLAFFYLWGGLPMLLWAGCFRTVFCLHAAFCVNSINHRFGYRNFDTSDGSTNSWWVALLTWGEGWHNNHHRFPTSARHGLRWWELDLSYLWIRLLAFVGLAWNVKTARYVPPVKVPARDVA